MNYEFINLTPETINLLDPDTKKVFVSFPSLGNVIVTSYKKIKRVNGVPIGTVEYLSTDGLPEPKLSEKNGNQILTVYILTRLAYNAAIYDGRRDVCFASGKIFKNEEGEVLGFECLSFHD